MIEAKFYQKAAAVVAEVSEGVTAHPDSTALLDGKLEAMAWCLAGKPAPTPEHNRTTANPYEVGTAESDAWQAGWAQGKALALTLGIVQPAGVIHQFERPNAPGWLEVLAEQDGYSWRLTDGEGEPVQSGSGYSQELLALHAALTACLAPEPSNGA